jgi:hypothetical protein
MIRFMDRDRERALRRSRAGNLRRERERRARKRARRVGAVGFVAAFALPILLWHDVVSAIASEFTIDAEYLVTGWSPWLLMALGLLCFINAAIIDLRNRDRRFYGQSTSAWFGWGVTLYLLGFGLATQVAQIADGLSTY